MKVRCPYCGWIQRTRARKTVRCFMCSRRYTIQPKRKPSRIVRIVHVARRGITESIPVEFKPATQLSRRRG
jgi:hypothetical protein